MGIDHPCLQCGACCAFFRVSFYWQETNPADRAVPVELTDPVDEFLQCMKGTGHAYPRCIALSGKIGEEVNCTIYDRRSSTCEGFGLHLKDGKIIVTAEDLERCNQARFAWQLPPLTRADLLRYSHYPPTHLARRAARPHHMVARKHNPIHYLNRSH